jgi:hypothetical protein
VNYLNELLKVGPALCDIIVLYVGIEYLKPLDGTYAMSTCNEITHHDKTTYELKPTFII